MTESDAFPARAMKQLGISHLSISKRSARGRRITGPSGKGVMKTGAQNDEVMIPSAFVKAVSALEMP